jgi:hypothetical protein
MPIDTSGWIEVSRFNESELTEEYAWQALLNVAAYIDVADEVTEILFGYSRRILRGEYQVTAVAKDRGLPTNPSDQVKAQIDQIQRLEKEYGKGEFFGYTHVYLNELKQIDWQQWKIAEINSDWFTLFSLLDKLLEDHRFKAHKVRIVVWFNE